MKRFWRERGYLVNAAKTFVIALIFVMLSALGGCRTRPTQSVHPAATWKDEFLPFTDQMLRATSLRPLRELAARGCDLNLRLWEGFGLKATKAYFIERNGHTWSAAYLRQALKPGEPTHLESLPPDGWVERLWDRLLKAGILTLVRSESMSPAASDGTQVVIELCQQGHYQAVLVGDPFVNSTPEANRALAVTAILEHQIGDRLRNGER